MHPFGLLRIRAARTARSSWVLAAGIGIAALVWEGHGVQADTSPIVAKVGARTVTAAELERRLAAVPPFQLRTFGNTPDEVKKNFLERVLVREALLSQGAEAPGPRRSRGREGEDPRRGAGAMLAKLRGEVAQNEKPTEADIRRTTRRTSPSSRRLRAWALADRRRQARGGARGPRRGEEGSLAEALERSRP